MSNQAPCKDCKDRTVGCHSSCERYKLYSQKRSEMIKKRNEWLNTRSPVARKAEVLKKRRGYESHFNHAKQAKERGEE